MMGFLVCVLAALIFKLFWCWPVFKIIVAFVFIPVFAFLILISKDLKNEQEEFLNTKKELLADFINPKSLIEQINKVKLKEGYVLVAVILKNGQEYLCDYIDWDENNNVAILCHNQDETSIKLYGEFSPNFIKYADIDKVYMI